MTWKTALFVIIAALVFSQYAPAEVKLSERILNACSDDASRLDARTLNTAELLNASENAGNALIRVEAVLGAAQIQLEKSECLFRVIESALGSSLSLRHLKAQGTIQELHELAEQMNKTVQPRPWIAAQLGTRALVQIIADMERLTDSDLGKLMFAEFREIYFKDLESRLQDLRADASVAKQVRVARQGNRRGA